jgi:hypothetical protein
VKLLLNAAASEDATLAVLDIKDFYLGAPLETKEYMSIHRSQLPQPVINEYGRAMDWRGDNVLVQVNNALYGLPQAGKVSNDKVIALLARNDYFPCPHTPCLFRHVTNGLYFTLVVDDYLLKFADKSSALHLIAALEQEYEVKVDWNARRYLGMTISHDRTQRAITLSMPGYVAAALDRFSVSPTSRPTLSPAAYSPPSYGLPDVISPPDYSPPLSPSQLKYVQAIIGVFLYYARAVDPTMLTQLNKLASQQATASTSLLVQVQHFLHYAATFPNAQGIFRASDMRLIVHSDASYLSESNARSRAGGNHFLSNHGDPTTVPLNAPIEAISIIISAVVAGAWEAEYAALFINGQAAQPTRLTLEDLGYPQLATPIIADNTTACGIATRSNRQRRSKAVDMRYHWIRDRVDQGQYSIHWRPGTENRADFFTKTLPASTFSSQRHHYVTDSAATTLSR